MNLLGVDIGGTKIAAGILDAQTGALLLSDRTPTRADQGGQAVLFRALELTQSVRTRAASLGLSPVVGVGIGAGGQIDSNGVVVHATDLLPGWAGTPLGQTFAEAFDLSAVADNDVNALAVGEARFGAGKGFANLLFLALGTGVGGALIANGVLLRGRNGAGGELGHLIVEPDGLICTCGGRGCLEQYASGAALHRRYIEAGGSEAVRVFELAEEMRGDLGGAQTTDPVWRDLVRAASRAVADTAEQLGVGLVSLVNCFAPDRIIIGGGLSALGDLLLDPAREMLARRALPGVRDTPVVVASLGADASIVGAATLVLETLEK